MNYNEKYKAWTLSPLMSEELLKELKAIKDNETEKKLRFAKDLEFGTAGLRGILGAGSNNMNNITVGWITQGLSNMLISRRLTAHGAVIGYDSRLCSQSFANLCARIFAANGIKVYLFKDICPTPEISFAVRRLNAAIGVNITASHNPKEYNGYKVYWADGAQISPEIAKEVVSFAGDNILCQRNICDFEKALNIGMIELLDENIDNEFLEKVEASIGQAKDYNKDLNIVYTPLYGSGYKLIPALLQKRGFNVTKVEEQMLPNGNYPTCNPPNPERMESYALGLQIAKEINADIILATDPDADRVGACILHNNEYKLLTGNQIGALLCRFFLENKDFAGKTPYVVKSLVSTDLVKPVCEKYGAKLYNVPTGFKYIGEKIGKYENDETAVFALGFEESYGYLGAGYARDKDAVFAANAVAQMAAYCKSIGKTCIDYLEEIYNEFGYYIEKTQGLDLDPLTGLENLNDKLNSFRQNPLTEIAGQKITEFKDYLKGVEDIPKLNIVEFKFENGSKIIIRPSGTEPKVKVYALCVGKTKDEALNICEKLSLAAKQLIL